MVLIFDFVSTKLSITPTHPIFTFPLTIRNSFLFFKPAMNKITSEKEQQKTSCSIYQTLKCRPFKLPGTFSSIKLHHCC
ncbi:MAG: hypothetical protein CSA36_00390 [Draconibacterium sp.]|nr:MAG: hypothetical protein CSA36_00390 [Draconibacterium sp.]